MTAQVDITVAALTLDADGRVTGAVADVAEPALTVGADGTVSHSANYQTVFLQCCVLRQV